MADQRIKVEDCRAARQLERRGDNCAITVGSADGLLTLDMDREVMGLVGVSCLHVCLNPNEETPSALAVAHVHGPVPASGGTRLALHTFDGHLLHFEFGPRAWAELRDALGVPNGGA